MNLTGTFEELDRSDSNKLIIKYEKGSISGLIEWWQGWQIDYPTVTI